jgi:LemA protein
MGSTHLESLESPDLWESLLRSAPRALLLIMVAACNKYQPTSSVEGTYYPNGCVQLDGFRARWSWPKDAWVNICEAVRVTEVGLLSSGGFERGRTTQSVARLEVAGIGAYVDLGLLKLHGRLDYRLAGPSMGYWTRNHPLLTAMLLVLLVIAMAVFAFSAIGKRNEFVGLREAVARSRSGVVDAWLRRIDLVNRMLQVAVHYENYERDVIEMVTRSFSKRGASVGAIVTNLTNSYPNLRASEQYKELMRQVAAQEEAARQALNEHNVVAERHNIAVNQFPWNMFWSSSPIAYLDTSMEQDLLPARWDEHQLKFIVRAELRN